MKIAYFGFDLFFDCLNYLSEYNEILKIFTCNVDGDYEFNDKTYALAKEKNIEITDEKITPEMIAELENKDCELIFSAGYYYKIPISNVIPAVNIHPVHLPEGRGPWPLPWLILKNIRVSAVTAHSLASDFDTGDIILQKKVELDDNENLETLTAKMQKAAADLTGELIADFRPLWQRKIPQTAGSYWKEPTVNDMTFTEYNDFDKIDRITRAFYGYSCYFEKDREILKIKEAICVKTFADVPAKTIRTYELTDGYLCILK